VDLVCRDLLLIHAKIIMNDICFPFTFICCNFTLKRCLYIYIYMHNNKLDILNQNGDGSKNSHFFLSNFQAPI